jgi:hypothetical protein
MTWLDASISYWHLGWDISYSLGLSATQIKDLCAAASKYDTSNKGYVWEVGIVLMFTKNCFHLSYYLAAKLA